jgi:hypothetical protein
LELYEFYLKQEAQSRNPIPNFWPWLYLH